LRRVRLARYLCKRKSHHCFARPAVTFSAVRRSDSSKQFFYKPFKNQLQKYKKVFHFAHRSGLFNRYSSKL